MKITERKRHSPWIDVTFTVIVITLTLIAGFLTFITIKSNTINETNVNSSPSLPPTKIETIQSNYPGFKIVTETSNDTYTPFAIQYPQSIHSIFNDNVKTYVKNAKQNYLNTMQNNKLLGLQSAGELNISFETFPQHSGSYSFVMVVANNYGSVKGTTEIRSFHLNPISGEAIEIQDVFYHDQKRLELVSELVRPLLLNDPALKNALFPEEVTINTEPIWENFNNFAITDEEIIFYFPELKLAPQSAGIPITAVPLRELDKVLANSYRDLDIINSPISNETDSQPIKDNKITKSPLANNDANESVENSDKSTDTGVKQVALTFDDGPDPKVTTQILETLDKYKAKATFFMLGSRVEYYPEIAKKVTDAGHELGNHTWNHPDLTKSSIQKVQSEINRTSSIIESVTGVKATAFRPPYGAVNKTVRAQTALPVYLWDVDTLDWKHRNANQLLASVQNKTKNGSIILMHDIHQSTADGLDAVLSYLQSEGFEFVSVSELN
ncbi:polysaccharide deacetylase family protein [Sporosarcina siberiensis]|uniref:Polysaccharide deacetylase family protein n=1 Tax=Sporosarcina siberiensis TaxID=1365606 RepID=A0ABW4SD29_9BACL